MERRRCRKHEQIRDLVALGRALVSFSEKVAELRKTDPLVGWDGVDKGHSEVPRVVKFLSEETD